MIGVGIDLVDLEVAETMLERWGDRLLKRVLTDGERAYVTSFPRPAKHLAVRLAAKEAVYKALQPLPGARKVSWRDIEVVRQTDGRPTVCLHGAAAELAEAGAIRINVSLSHSGGTAGAVAVVERD